MVASPVDGTFRFNSQGNKEFRYRVEENSIWVQDKKSKLQWKCTLADATELDKCQWIQGNGMKLSVPFVLDNLRVALGSTNAPSHVDLTYGEGDTRALIFHLYIGHGDAIHNIPYRFVLEPIALERIDILEAQLHDLQEAVEGKEYAGERITWTLETTLDDQRFSRFLEWQLTSKDCSNLLKVKYDTIEIVETSYYTISVVAKGIEEEELGDDPADNIAEQEKDDDAVKEEDDESEDEIYEEPLLKLLRNNEIIRTSLETIEGGDTCHLLETTLFLKSGDQLKIRNAEDIPKGTKLVIHLLR